MRTLLEIENADYGAPLKIEECGEHEGCTILDLSEEYPNEFHATPASLHEIVKALMAREREIWKEHKR